MSRTIIHQRRPASRYTARVPLPETLCQSVYLFSVVKHLAVACISAELGIMLGTVALRHTYDSALLQV